MRKGCRVVGEKVFFDRKYIKLNHHAADKNGRMYWCNCIRSIRLGGTVKFAVSVKSVKTTGKRFKY